MVSDRVSITLSGIVGSGKSSAAKAIVHALRSAGCSAEYIRFQEFTELRARVRHPVSSMSPGRFARASAAPGRGEARGGGYRRRRLTTAIAAGYVARTFLFRLRLRRWPKDTVLVFDRYFYDSLAHFDLSDAGVPLKLLMKAIPAPTLAALLLIGEATILQRRSRYSPEYAHQVAKGYEELAQTIPGLLVVRTDDFASVADAAGRIVASVLAKVGRRVDG